MASNDNKTLQTLTRQATQRVDLTESEVERLVLLLQRFLETSVRRAARRLPTDATVREAAKMLSDLDLILASEDFGQRLSGFRDLFEKELVATGLDFTETTDRVAPLSGIVRRDLAAIADERLDLVTKIADRYLVDVRQAILDGVVLGLPVSADRALEDVGERTFQHITTEMNTAYMAYQRLVHLKKAEKVGITKFLYFGPNDKITRPFCQERVGRVYSLEQIETWDNEQGLPAAIYCGGYRCRHHLRPVSDALAEEFSQGANGT